MNAYVDASVVLRVVLGETARLPSWERISGPVSSALLRLESLRSIDRARILGRLDDAEVAEKRAALMEAIHAFTLVPITSAVLDRAAEPFPTLVGSLDAIHLASALVARESFEDLVFATHDDELGIAARSVGFRVEGLAR